MSSDSKGRSAATSSPMHAPSDGPLTPGVDAPAEVLEFIRYCYRRRGIGWPELYDEMCAVAARGSYRGMDYEGLGRLGIGFSLGELPRLAALSHRIVAEERAARQGEARLADARRDELRRDQARGAAGIVATPAT